MSEQTSEQRCTCTVFISVPGFAYSPEVPEDGALKIAHCPLHEASTELLEVCRFVKRWFITLEDGLPESDPLTKLRREFHAPIHAKLDAAIAKATAP